MRGRVFVYYMFSVFELAKKIVYIGGLDRGVESPTLP